MNWKYRNIEIKTTEELIDTFGFKPYGFVYIIKNKTNGKYYIGKKAIEKGKKWQNYFGSSKDLTEDIKLQGKDNFERIILSANRTSKMLTYGEMAKQIYYNVLADENSYNRNIAGRYFKKDFK
jgi:hypothetical protein